MLKTYTEEPQIVLFGYRISEDDSLAIFMAVSLCGTNH